MLELKEALSPRALVPMQLGTRPRLQLPGTLQKVLVGVLLAPAQLTVVWACRFSASMVIASAHAVIILLIVGLTLAGCYCCRSCLRLIVAGEECQKSRRTVAGVACQNWGGIVPNDQRHI